ncbi:MAG: hypothetical protein J6U54_08445 [Clostridiales bacterium]|nr:hypothetical protein [Clostridiales bacterium]
MADTIEKSTKSMADSAGQMVKVEKVVKKFGENYAESSKKAHAATGVIVKDADKLENSTNGVSTALSNTADKIKNSGETIQTTLKSTGNTFVEFLGRMKESILKITSIGELLSFGVITAVLIVLVNLGKAIGRISRLARSFGRVGDSISQFMRSLTAGANYFAIVEISIAIGLLAASLFVLSKLVDPRSLIIAAAAIGGLLLVFAASTKILDSMKPTLFLKLGQSARYLVGFSASILILAVALQKINSMSGGLASLISSVAALIVLLGALTVIALILGSRELSTFKGGMNLIMIAGSLYIVCASLEKLGKMDLKAAAKAMPILLEILAALGGIILASTIMFSPVAGLGLLGIVSAILLMIKCCESLTTVDTGVLDQVLYILERIASFIKDVIFWLGLFKAAVVVAETVQSWLAYLSLKVNAVNSIVTKMFAGINAAAKRVSNAVSIASLFVGISAAILMIAIAMEKIANMTANNQIATAGAVVVAIVVAMMAIIGALYMVSDKLAKSPLKAVAFSTTMTAISTMLISMSVCFGILSILPASGIGQAVFALSMISLFIIGIVAILALINKEIGPANVQIAISTMVAISILLGTMAVTFALLAIMPTMAWLKGAGGLILVFGGISVLLVLLSKLAPLTITATVAVGLMSLLFATVTACFYFLQNIDGGKVLDNLGFMLLAITGLTAVVAGLGFLINGPLAVIAGPGAAAFGVLILLMGSLAEVGVIASQIQPEVIKDVFVKVGEGLISLAGSMLSIGAAILTTPPSVLIALAGSLLFLAKVLPAVGIGFLAFGVGALAFGAGINLIGTGLASMFEALAKIKEIDMSSVAQGLGDLGIVLAVLGVLSPLIIVAAGALISLSIAIAIFTGAMALLATENIFDNLLENCQELGGAIDTLAEHFLSFIGVAVMLGVAAAAVLALGAAVVSLAAALLALAVIGTIINSIFSKLSTSIQDAVAAMGTLTTDIVVELYNNLSENESTLNAIGQEMCLYMADGFREQIEPTWSDIIDDTAISLNTAAKAKVDMVTEAAKILGSAWDIGLRDAAGHSYCENDYVEIADDSATSMYNEADRVKGTAEAGGAILGNSFGSGLWDKLKGWLNNITDAIKEWAENIKKGIENGLNFIGIGVGGGGGEDGISTLLSDYKKEIGKINKYTNNFDRYVADGTYQYIPGVGYVHYKSGKVMKDLIGEKSGIYADALDGETSATDLNTGAVGDNSKAKGKNAKANEKKTKEIKEETEATEEETEAVEDNSEAIREMAEQIEVVTKEYNKLNHYQGISKATVVRLANNSKRINKLWSGEITTLRELNKQYKEVKKSIPNMVKSSKRGLYAFGDGIKNVQKIYKKTGLKKSVDTIRKYVERTGNSVAKVTANTLKVFYKAGNKVEKIFLNPVKKMSKIPGMLKKALNTVAFFNRDMTSVINSYEWSDDVISHVRMIEESFGRVKFGQMSGGIQNYLKNVLGRFKELNPAISQISKSLGGTYNVFSKNSRAAAATADSLISLGAVLYNGSDAANEYATKIAQLEFLYEHGEVSWEELQEAKIDYLTRIKDALMEYKQSLDETYMSEVDFFSAFNKNALDKNVNLMENLFSNISGYYTYGAMLTELSRRVPALQESTQLVKMLADAGVDSFGKLQKVLEMSTSELNAYIYGIGVLNKTQEEASNKAFAAVANATSYAAKRQQAQAKDVMKKTTKYSKDVRKAIMSDMDAVAQATTEYNILTKKQEKEYLKTLTKEEQKYYKKQKSYYKKAKKDYEAQRKAQTEKEYVKQLLENIKTFADYSKALAEYTGDTKALTSFTNKFNEAFADLSKNAKEVGVNLDAADDSLLIFAETLDATGEDGLNYFEEMAKRIQNMIDGIKESVTNVNILTTAFEKAASVKFKNVYDNVLSNLIGSNDIVSQLSTLATKGYSTDVLKKLKDIYDSDRSAALEMIKALNSASADEVKRTNAAMEKYSTTAANTEANMWVKLLKDAEKTKAEREKKQTDALNKYNQAVNTRKAKENELKALQSQKDTIDAEKQRLKELKKNVKDGDKLSKKTEKEYIALLKKYGGTYKGKSYLVSAPLETWFDENGVQKSGTAYAKLKSDIAKAEKEVNALRDAEDKAHQEYLDATKQLEEYNAELKKSIDNVTKDENAKKWFDSVIKGEKTLLTAIKFVTKGTHEYVKALGYATELQTKFDKERIHYNIDGLYSNIKALEDATAPIGTIVDGLDSFGKSLVEAADRTAEGIIEAIEEYKKNLTDTIKQSSDFFSKFSGFADEDNPLQATDYLEYADSQINALETWRKNLEKLADLGLDKELIEKFASQGLGSYEIVNAFAKATKAQIGEYNYQWEKYQETITAATESAMTSIAASWSTAGQALSQSMIDYFGSSGADRLKEAGYEASAMVITGVKDGLTEAMPSIISAVEHTDTSGMSKAIGKSVGQGINTGLVEAVQGSVNETVTAVIEKFKMAVDSVLAYVNEVLPSEYTITIHVDTSEIDAAVARMNQAIYSTNVTAGQTSNAVASSTANQAATEVVPSEPVTNTVNLNYTQNNYSPKALDQVEIYRNTQNQLNSTKNALELQGAG